MKALRVMVSVVMLMSLLGFNSAFAFNDGGACYYKTFEEGQFVECGDDGCLYPDGTTMTPDGYFDADGEEMTDDLVSPDELFGVDKKVCYGKDGNVLGDESFDGEDDDHDKGIEDESLKDKNAPPEGKKDKKMEHEDDKGPKKGPKPEKFEDDNFEYEFEYEENFDFYEDHLNQFDLESEIQFMEEEMAAVKAVFASLKDIDDKKVQKASEKLNTLAEKAIALLAKMKAVIVNGEVTDEAVVEDAWDMMDGMEKDAMKQIKVLVKYFEKNPEALAALSSEDKAHVEGWMEEEKGGKKGPGGMGKGNGPKFDEIYESFGVKGPEKAAMMQKIKNEVMDDVMRKVEGQLMAELSKYLDEDIIADMLNNIDYLGKGYLKNSVGVYGKVDEFKGQDDGFKRLGKMTKEMVISDEVASELAAKWDEVDMAFANDDQDALDMLEGEIEDLLEKNKELVFRSDDAVMFEDLELGHWSTEYVFELKKDGVIDGYRDKDGKKLGQFKPENDVTLGELLKMGAEASGKEIHPGKGKHWAEKAGYADLAKELGLDKLIDISDLNKAATREEAAVMIAELFDYDVDAEWEAPFDDYKGEHKGYVQAVYDEGVFTGNGETGEFMGEKHLNRAEVAKVIRVAGEDLDFDWEMDDFLEKLDELEVAPVE